MARKHMLLACAAAACVHTPPAPDARYWIASDSSQYTPTARLRVAVSTSEAHIRITIDSGIIAIPGLRASEAPAIMRHLYLTAYIAGPNTDSLAVAANATGKNADRRAWRALAISDSTLVVDQLRFGERRTIGPITFQFPNVAHDPHTSPWLVFRISGNTVSFSAPLAQGGDRQAREIIGGVSVYACGDHDVRGRIDTARTNELQRAYGQIC